ncbi:hypothetical protein CEE36_07790 [candidate division TA06 bacterium B3_TA06]|uniref:Secretion system C-terminal sorting domain-containing protein n=1 Tax=candidate division TA06 bacterium B3_TA06 TaxID=2012487 RepID=A0A532V471_UNCT6|nr:MAG: hypothetical protein CEE36_07790 [candidate division TA06 bacterium B3_TA06]
MKKFHVITAILLVFLTTAYAGWEKNLGEEGAFSNNSARETLEGEYIVSSTPQSLIKTDKDGAILWAKNYDFFAGSVEQTTDSGYILTGSKINALCLFKTNSAGDTQWSRTYRVRQAESCGRCVKQTSDGGYIAVGEAQELDSIQGASKSVYLVRTKANGDTLWTRTYGGAVTDANYREGLSVIECPSGGYIVSGIKGNWEAFYHNLDLWLFKAGNDGKIVWDKEYKASESNDYDEAGNCVCMTDDGGYILTGYKTNPDSTAEKLIWLLKTDSLGDTLWTRSLGTGVGNSLCQTSDGGYIITGEPYSLIKTNASGDTLWTHKYGGEGNSVRETSDSGYIISATISGSDNKPYLWLIKTDSMGIVSGIEEPAPVTPVTQPDWQIVTTIGPHITLRALEGLVPLNLAVFDASGRKVDEIHLAGQTLTWGEGYRPGVYFIRIEGDASATTHKVILIH